MGYGLRPKPDGVHIAFAAGTGVLCFVDLVAMIANFMLNIRQRNSSIQGNGEMGGSFIGETDLEKFQFHLYASFRSRKDSVALELFEALEDFCRRGGYRSFHLHLRLSQEKVNPQRWDEAFIRQEIGKFGIENISKVWVCGPPVMNETFDRVFSARPRANASDNQGEGPLLDDGQTVLSPEQFEIL